MKRSRFNSSLLALTLLLCPFSQGFADEKSSTAQSDEKLTTLNESLIFPFNTMSESETSSTGIEKLSKEEQEKLLSWIRSKDMNLKEAVIGSVVAIKENGKMIELSDGKTYSIGSSSNRNVCAKWANGDEIEITALGKARSYLLKNKKTQETVKAKEKTETKKKKK